MRISSAFIFACCKRVRACLSLSVASLYRSSASRMVLKMVRLRLVNKLLNESRLSIYKSCRLTISSQTEHEFFDSSGFPAHFFFFSEQDT